MRWKRILHICEHRPGVRHHHVRTGARDQLDPDSPPFHHQGPLGGVGLGDRDDRGRYPAVIVGLLIGLATLFATIGGVRYTQAGGNPGEVEAAKRTLKYAAVGYSVAALAPLLVKILQSIVGVA